MDVVHFILCNAFYVLVIASVIPALFWMREFKKELQVKHLWQIVLYLACLYGIGTISTYGTADLQNWIFGEDLANRRGWSNLFTMPLFYLLVAKLTKRDLKIVSDILGIQVMLIYSFGRTACIFQGCCLGKYISGTNYRWPLVAIEVLFVFVFIYIFGKKAYERRFDGKSYPVFLIAYGAFRMLLEIFRDVDDLPYYYFLFGGCLLFIISGVGWLLGLYRSKKTF